MKMQCCITSPCVSNWGILHSTIRCIPVGNSPSERMSRYPKPGTRRCAVTRAHGHPEPNTLPPWAAPAPQRAVWTPLMWHQDANPSWKTSAQFQLQSALPYLCSVNNSEFTLLVLISTYRKRRWQIQTRLSPQENKTLLSGVTHTFC